MKPLIPNPPATVYRHLNAEGQILYIGCSVNPMGRFGQHRSQSPWAREVVNISLQWFDSQEDALVEEARQIKEIRPPHNRQLDRVGRGWTPNPGHKVLALWLVEKKLTVTDLAKAMGSTIAIAKALLKPSSHPRYLLRNLLAVVTSGAVPTFVWDRRSTLNAPLSGEMATIEYRKSCERLKRCKHPIPQQMKDAE